VKKHHTIKDRFVFGYVAISNDLLKIDIRDVITHPLNIFGVIAT
jgi:hypothetical protein